MLHIILLLLLNLNLSDDIAIENLVGNWERVCIKNDALGFKISHCNFFGDRKIYINEWNYIEMTFKNGDRKFYDFSLDGDEMKIHHKYGQTIDNLVQVVGDTLIIESKEVYNEFINLKYDANYNRVYFVRNN